MIKRLFISLLTTLLGLAFVGTAVVVLLFSYFGTDLPDYKQLAVYEPPIVTRLYTGDGRLFHEYALERRVFVPIKAIPKLVKYSFLSAEDKNFYSHPGIDFSGLLRAFLTNIIYLAKNRRVVGASTITQQVARNFLLSDEISIERKIKEAILAFRIDHTFDKDHILELYLNEIYLGAGSYGVASAALNYFNKALIDLTLAEAAFLASLPKAPNNYHPIRFRERALARRNWVLQRMAEDGVITDQEAAQAMKEAFTLKNQDLTTVVHADHFAEELRRQLIQWYGNDVLYKGGLVVHTTLNTKLQTLADKHLRQGLINYDRRHGWRGPLAHSPLAVGADKSASIPQALEALGKISVPSALGPWMMAIVISTSAQSATLLFRDGRKGSLPLSELKWARRYISADAVGPVIKHPKDVLFPGDVVAVMAVEPGKDVYKLCQIPQVDGALVVMDPHTGRVLGMSGGYSYNTSEFNRAVQALRQPGSAFKPIVYLTALEKGFMPWTIIDDAPIAIDLGHGLGQWKPNNITKKFYGPSPLRVGLEKSRNAMTVRLAQMVGIEAIGATTEKLGIMDKMPLQMAMVLGAGGTTVLKMATAYAMIANGGKKIQPTFVDRIQDRQGRTVFRHDKRTYVPVDVEESNLYPQLMDDREQIIDPIHAYQMVSMMEGVVQRGTAKVALKVNKPLAAKTGTTNTCMDAWTIGFTPDLLVAVYIGFDTPKTLGDQETGSRVAAPIFADFMTEALAHSPPVPFRIPAGASFVQVSLDTGQVAKPGDKNIILEVFKENENQQNSLNDALGAGPEGVDSLTPSLLPNLQGVY